MTAPPTDEVRAAGAGTEAATRRRGIGAWIAIGLVLLVVGAAGAALSGLTRWSERAVLDPESAGPDGTRALVQILRDHGVDVAVARDRGAAAAALGDGPATLVLTDTPALSDDGVGVLMDRAADVVLLDPRARTIRLVVPGWEPAGLGTGSAVAPACDLDDAQRAGPVAPDAVFRAEEDGGAGGEGCYPSGDGVGLVVATVPSGRHAVVDGRALFVNAHLAENGNAALALNLMGRHPLVVWYQPGPGDTDLPNTDPTLGELTPPWVSPAILLLAIAGVAAGVHRGRRFGPLVTERLPVTVRARETTEGRARLYAHSRDAAHAADELRIASLGRLRVFLALPPSAGAGEIADAAAWRVGADPRAVRGILFADVPRTDRDLVALHERLVHLEEAVARAVRPERNTP